MNLLMAQLVKKLANKSIHADCQKRRGFRYATATPLLAAGDAKRSRRLRRRESRC